MAETHFSRKLKTKLIEFIDDRAHSLGRGEAHSFESYRQQVGMIEGLGLAIDLIKDLDKELD